MSKCDEWFRSLIAAVEKDPSWDIDFQESAFKPIPDRAKSTKSRQEINNPKLAPKYRV